MLFPEFIEGEAAIKKEVIDRLTKRNPAVFTIFISK